MLSLASFLCLCLLRLSLLPSILAVGAHAAAVDMGAVVKHVEGSYWYDWAFHGAYPKASYESFGATSPFPNLLQTDPRCQQDHYVFVEPRGKYVDTPGPVILDNDGNLVWTNPQWGQVMDLKVQRFQGKDHITFWHGSDNGTFGEGYYLMLDETYEVVRKVVPVGGLAGDLHEFRITDDDTALMTIYHKVEADMSDHGITRGWIYDSLFQEVDLVTGQLLFEWRASDHFPVHESMAPMDGMGRSPSSAIDFFHINSIDKDDDGNYLVSSRFLCAVICLDGESGKPLWQLGGYGNTFEDLSDGKATDFAWNHHASWARSDNTTITVFDNGSNGEQTTAKHSRGVMISLDLDSMSATLVQSYVAPQRLLVPSQGSVQALPNSNVLVGWGHTAAWTEFSRDGEVLCDTHIGPIWFATLGWVKNYRTFKFPWVGRPALPPDMAVRPSKGVVYASWNGATEVATWQIESAQQVDADNGGFQRHEPPVKKTTFETRLRLPEDAGPYVRVVALARDGVALGRSKAVPKTEKTVTPLLEAPSRGAPMEPLIIFAVSLLATVLIAATVYCYQVYMRRGVRKGFSMRRSLRHNYQKLPTDGTTRH